MRIENYSLFDDGKVYQGTPDSIIYNIVGGIELSQVRYINKKNIK
jgi:hypothetical protein